METKVKSIKVYTTALEMRYTKINLTNKYGICIQKNKPTNKQWNRKPNESNRSPM